MNAWAHLGLYVVVLILLAACSSIPSSVNGDAERFDCDYSNRTLSIFPFSDEMLMIDSMYVENEDQIRVQILESMQETLVGLCEKVQIQEETGLLDYIPGNDTIHYRQFHMGEENKGLYCVDDGSIVGIDWFLIPNDSLFVNMGFEPDIVLIPTWLRVYTVYERWNCLWWTISETPSYVGGFMRFMIWDYREQTPLLWGNVSTDVNRNDYKGLGKGLLINALAQSGLIGYDVITYNGGYDHEYDLLAVLRAICSIL